MTRKRRSLALENKNIFHINYSNMYKFIVPDKSLGHLYGLKKIETTELELSPQLPTVGSTITETENCIGAGTFVNAFG